MHACKRYPAESWEPLGNSRWSRDQDRNVFTWGNMKRSHRFESRAIATLGGDRRASVEVKLRSLGVPSDLKMAGLGCSRGQTGKTILQLLFRPSGGRLHAASNSTTPSRPTNGPIQSHPSLTIAIAKLSRSPHPPPMQQGPHRICHIGITKSPHPLTTHAQPSIFVAPGPKVLDQIRSQEVSRVPGTLASGLGRDSTSSGR